MANPWVDITIGDLADEGFAEIRTGPFGTQLRASDYSDDGVPVLNVRNLGFGTLRRADLERVGTEVQERLSAHLLREGDIVFGRKGAVDRHVFVAAAQSGWMQGSDCIRLRILPDSPVIPSFLSKALLTEQHKTWMEAQCSHGATMSSLNQDIIRRISLHVPDAPTQRRIAAVLSAFDELIEINERRIELLADLARSLYREWFVHFRFPGHETVDLVDSELGPIPEGWEVRKLREIAAINELTFKSADLPDPFWYLDISTVGVGVMGAPAVIPAADAPGRARRKLRDGDVVWATVRPNRRAHALVHNPPEDLVASTGLAVLSPVDVPSSFLFEYASDTFFSDYLVRQATGSAYPAVRPADFERAPALVPPPALLLDFDRAMDGSLRLVSSLRAHNRQLATTRDLPLPRLVTGHLDISDLDLGVLTPTDIE